MTILIFSLVGCSQHKSSSTTTTSDQKVIEEEDKLSVVASIYPMADFAAKIGGDLIDLKTMVPPGTDAHGWEPSTGDIIALNEADVFIYNGSGMEGWTESILDTLENPDLIVIEASAGLTVPFSEHQVEYIDGTVIHEDENDHADDEENHENEDIHEESEHDHEADHHHHHDHDGMDPHVWLDPDLAGEQMKAIAKGFIEADPDNKDIYENNLTQMEKKLDALDDQFEKELEGIKKRDIVVSHAAFGYLCQAYDLNELAITGVSPESEPSPEDMATIIKVMEEKQITTIFFETLATPKVAETIAAETGANVDTLNPIEGLTEENIENGDDYFSLMEKNLDALVKALK